MMSESEKKTPPAPVPAATILIVRDGASGLEVFMVKRHHQIDFVAGALVFPGGKVSKGDFDAGLLDVTDGVADWSTEMRAMGAAAIREAFEESGILFAREPGRDELISAARADALSHYRHALEKNELTLHDMLKAENLRLACDRLVRFAHWITPEMMPKRFDTQFFLAAAPQGHTGSHDGRESVDSIWITPHDAISDRKKWNVIFPTKLNLMKLGKSPDVASAIESAHSTEPLPVTPWTEQGPNGPILRIRDDAGYEQTWASMKEAM
jgi:8-oxo-dGTP pyrophosphatase MutT (NUDIX family)